MDLNLAKRFFVVTGAGSGFGRAIAERLLDEGATVLAVARTESVLLSFQKMFPSDLQIIAGDVSERQTQERIIAACSNRFVDGVLINAGGPPAKPFLETSLDDWDTAYNLLLRWKVSFCHKIIPVFQKQGYGRLLFIESVSVKQAVDQLVLSNSLRLAVVGFVKSLAKDLADQNITLNILAPGYHDTAAMKRLFERKAYTNNSSVDEARKELIHQIPVGRLGSADELAVLATWLLSPLSGFVTGQTISHDGGLVQGNLG